MMKDGNFKLVDQRRRSSSANENKNTTINSEQSEIVLKPPRDLINYGERLYQKGMKRREEQLRLLKEVKQM